MCQINYLRFIYYDDNMTDDIEKISLIVTMY
jgi:hypothetical protein